MQSTSKLVYVISMIRSTNTSSCIHFHNVKISCTSLVLSKTPSCQLHFKILWNIKAPNISCVNHAQASCYPSWGINFGPPCAP